MPAPLHVIFDTNVLFSAIGWRGVPWQCVELARAGRVRAFTCEALMEELKDKLSAKLALTSAEVLALAATAAADRIVSGDRDLLCLGSFVGIPILSPRDFLTQFERLPAA